ATQEALPRAHADRRRGFGGTRPAQEPAPSLFVANRDHRHRAEATRRPQEPANARARKYQDFGSEPENTRCLPPPEGPESRGDSPERPSHRSTRVAVEHSVSSPRRDRTSPRRRRSIAEGVAPLRHLGLNSVSSSGRPTSLALRPGPNRGYKMPFVIPALPA